MNAQPDLGPGAVVLRAWAPWCGHCRAMHPIVQDVAASNSVRVVDLQVDQSPELTDRLRIRSVPTLLAFRDGVEVGRLIGGQPRSAIESLFGLASNEVDRLRPAAPGSLLAARLGSGAALGVAGLVVDSLPLAAAGAVVGLWGLVGVVRRATTARPGSAT